MASAFSAASRGAGIAHVGRHEAVVRHRAVAVGDAGIRRRHTSGRSAIARSKCSTARRNPSAVQLFHSNRPRRYSCDASAFAVCRFRSLVFCAPVSFSRSASEICQAISSCTVTRSLTRCRNCSPHSCDSVDASTSSAWMFSMSPCCTIRPVRIVRALSASPTVAGSACRPLYLNTRLRGTIASTGQLREAVDDALGDAVGQVLERRVDARVEERQHRERLASRARPAQLDENGRGRRRRARLERVQRERRNRGRTRTAQPDLWLTARDTIARSSSGARGSNTLEIRRLSCRQTGDHFVRSSAAEQPAPGQHLVEHAAEREDVAAPVHAAAGHLLGRHVAERAEHDPLRGMRDRRAVGGNLRALEPLQREAEVQNLYRAVRRQEDVLRLQVTVDHAARVRSRQAVGDGRRRSERPRATGRRPSRFAHAVSRLRAVPSPPRHAADHRRARGWP